MPNLPVFKIKREDGSLGTKTIHRDHLLPIGQLVRMPLTDQVKDPPARPKTRADTCKKSQRDLSPETQEFQELSDSSSDMEYYVPHCVTQREPQTRVQNTARPVVDLEDDPETENDDDRKAEPVHEEDSDPEDVNHNSETEPKEEEHHQEVAPEETSESGSESNQEVSEVQDKVKFRSEHRPLRELSSQLLDSPMMRLVEQEISF
ncbi:hypothetical protein N1851_020724 [Merluccius polli]|uniref:Uncharacterized protein n=1 Tax=Merluccius polli TaxID=89951 RepID=A0AA47NZK0_MERPO|nr:hypothetical protein N1851_020724 [Merluccius polli]